MKSENNKNNMDIENPKQDSSKQWQMVKDHKIVISILACSALLIIIIVAVVASLDNSNPPTGINQYEKYGLKISLRNLLIQT